MWTESAALKAGNGRGAVINDNMREEPSEDRKGEQREVDESASSTVRRERMHPVHSAQLVSHQTNASQII